MHDQNVSIAIETSCRDGGVALGVGGKMVGVRRFQAAARHAIQLIPQLDHLLNDAGLKPRQVNQMYVSVGPGSFTGLRIGVTVARTMAQMVERLPCVAVPTPQVVAENARQLPWQHLGVILDAQEGQIYATVFRRQDTQIVPTGQPQLTTPAAFLSHAPRPILLIGEGLSYHDLSAPDVQIGPEALHLPQVENVWRLGQTLAEAGMFTPAGRLLPTYARQIRPLQPLADGDNKQAN